MAPSLMSQLVLAAACMVAASAEIVKIRDFEDYKRIILDSPAAWMLTVLEEEDRCPPETCGKILEVLNTVHGKAGGLLNMAWVSTRVLVQQPGSSEFVPLAQHFNITAIPEGMLYNAGPKTLDFAMRFEAQMWGRLLSAGPKTIYDQLKTFIPFAGASAKLRSRMKLQDFLTAAQPVDLPRVLLVTDKAEVSLLMKVLSVDFAPRAVFGQASEATAEVKEALGLAAGGLPALYIIPAGTNKLPGDAGTTADEAWERYTGPLGYAETSAWLAKMLPQPTFPQIFGPDSFARHCTDKPGICFLALLPSHAAEPGTVAYDAVAAATNRSFVKPDFQSMSMGGSGGVFTADRLQLSFAWVDASVQSSFPAAFGNAPVPSLVALNPRKKLFALHRGSLTPENVESFVLAMMHYGLPDTPWSKGTPASELVTLETLSDLPVPVTQVPADALKAALGGNKKKAAAGSGGSKKPTKASNKGDDL